MLAYFKILCNPLPPDMHDIIEIGGGADSIILRFGKSIRVASAGEVAQIQAINDIGVTFVFLVQISVGEAGFNCFYLIVLIGRLINFVN